MRTLVRILQRGNLLDEAKIVIHKKMYFFLIPLPSGLDSKLLNGLHNDHTESAWVGGSVSFFAVGGLSPDKSEAHAALRFVWNELLERELVSGVMPDPTEGHPLAELRK